jgi:hypothetical protein
MLIDELSKIHRKAKESDSVFKICDEKIKPKLIEAATAGQPSATFNMSALVALVRQDIQKLDDWLTKEGLSWWVANGTAVIYGWDKNYVVSHKAYSEPVCRLFLV